MEFLEAKILSVTSYVLLKWELLVSQLVFDIKVFLVPLVDSDEEQVEVTNVETKLKKKSSPTNHNSTI